MQIRLKLLGYMYTFSRQHFLGNDLLTYPRKSLYSVFNTKS